MSKQNKTDGSDMPLPILTNRPLQARNNTTSEDYEDSEFDTEDGDGGILTPTSTQARASGLEDMPPTYEQAQAQSLRDFQAPVPGLRTQQPSRQEIAPVSFRPSRVAVSHDSKPGSTRAEVVETGQSPSGFRVSNPPPARIVGESLCVAVPLNIATKTNKLPQFQRAYSLRVSNFGIPSSVFTTFVDDINVLLQGCVSLTSARRSLLSLADPVDEDITPLAAQLSDCLDNANATLFNPKGLEVTFQTVVNLIHNLGFEHQTRRQEAVRLRKGIWDAKSEKEAVTLLVPYVEPLTWFTPISMPTNPSAGPFPQQNPHAQNSTITGLRAAQCPWEADESFDAGGPSAEATDSTAWSSLLTPTTTRSIQAQDRANQSSAVLNALLDDSATDSETSTISDTEARIHSQNQLAEAYRHYLSVTKSIERLARDKIFGLDDRPHHSDIAKYEGKRCAKLNHAAAVKHAADVKYSTTTLQRRQRRAGKWLERELKTGNKGQARKEHGRRVAKEASKHGERVRRAGEHLSWAQQDRASDLHETLTGHAKGRGKLAWEVWLTVRNL